MDTVRSEGACIISFSVTILLYIFHLGAGTQCTTQTCLACDSLELNCNEGEFVTGFVDLGWRPYTSPDTTCGYVDGDCSGLSYEQLPTVMECMWKAQQCTFTLGSPFFPIAPHNCTTHVKATYIQGHHIQCVPEQNLHQLCITETRLVSAADSSSPHFILSPGFPEASAKHSDDKDFNSSICGVEIHTVSGHGIKVWSVFMDLQHVQNGRPCDEYIELSHPEKSLYTDAHTLRFCGRDNFEVEWPYSAVNVFFFFDHLNKGRTKQSFALRYESYKISHPETTDYVTISTTPEIFTTTTTNQPVTPSPVKGSPTESNQPTVLSTVVIVVICLALFFLLFTAVVVIMILVRKKPRQDTYVVKSESDSDGMSFSIPGNHV